ncbi:hypothetical protein [Ammoniphilus sp. YIM 78166]|uniref:hypothetical protein n=1 Tax=Ammoniphilus sp. YIM 78166 TaxID=1644106 RepID=UPI00106FDBE6|nr:hypothetical protein [Ammoniphilus sp. YIM 78166]
MYPMPVHPQHASFYQGKKAFIILQDGSRYFGRIEEVRNGWVMIRSDSPPRRTPYTLVGFPGWNIGVGPGPLFELAMGMIGKLFIFS